MSSSDMDAAVEEKERLLRRRRPRGAADDTEVKKGKVEKYIDDMDEKPSTPKKVHMDAVENDSLFFVFSAVAVILLPIVIYLHIYH